MELIPNQPKKRGRKSKNTINNITEENNLNNSDANNNQLNLNDNNIDFNKNNEISENNVEENDPVDQKLIIKKRGRKPKGGKIIQNLSSINNNNIESKPNIILHLKCYMKDLEYNSIIDEKIESFHFSNNKNDILSYEIINDNQNDSDNLQFNDKMSFSELNNKYYNKEEEIEYNDNENDCFDDNKYNKNKEVWKKLKQLQNNLHLNNVTDKKSDCFWCHHSFDNPPIYIPKFYIKESYHVYGCFCSPECAVAHLMKENIDSSTRFERYYLINHIYNKIYDYDKNIKPAPNPFYMLDKYYGNLTIQEYRSLLRNERLFLVVDKPLTRILPELHEDNNDFIINSKIIPSNTYQIKKKLQKKNQNQQNKNNILCEKFGLQ